MLLDAALVLPSTVTVSGTMPATRGGLFTAQLVEPEHPVTVALALPKFTVMPDFKLTPLIVTDKPPVVGPSLGLKLLMAGAW